MAHQLNILEMTSIRASHDDHDTNRIFINVLQCVVGVHDEPVGRLDRYKACLHFEVSIYIDLVN